MYLCDYQMIWVGDRCAAADFFVDTIKCNGLTTTTDTLWNGVPGITMPTLKMAARGGASIASAGGVASLSVLTHKGYEDQIIELIS